MNHHSTKRKFGREAGQRDALIESLARSLVIHNQITTTLAKAKELRPFVEKLVTKGKVGTLSARRLIASRVDEEIAKTMIEVVGPKYKDRKGGYLRIVKLPRRETDGSEMAIIEFV